MSHEPDWESLGSLQFLLHQRISEHLNAALSAIRLADKTTSAVEAEDFWQQQATQAVQRTLDLENAWSSLVRYKLGERTLPQNSTAFRASALVRWLAAEIRMPHAASADQDMLLVGNREALQEALLLLHSCAGTLGPHVRLVVSAGAEGLWLRIRYNLVKNAPPTLAALTEALGSAGNWRADAALFELQRAEDFLTMNGCALHYTITSEHGELAFCVPAVSATDTFSASAPVLATDDDTARDSRATGSDVLSTPIVSPVKRGNKDDARDR